MATGTAVTMGQTESFIRTYNSPNIGSDVVSSRVEAGEYVGIAVDPGKISQEQMEAMKTKLEATKAKLEAEDFTNLTKDDILGDLLYTTALSYYAELDAMNYVSVKKMGIVNIRLPSEADFSYELQVNKFMDIPMSVQAGGLIMDVARNINVVKPLDGDKDKKVQFLLSAGMNSSALEHSVPEQLFSTPDNPAEGISAVKALKIANDQGIPIYTINETNIDSILPQLEVDSDVITDIQNAVNAEKVVTVSKTNINFNGWNGVGYIIIDPDTGNGAYMISGGLNGGWVYAAWLAGLIVLLILASFGLAALTALGAIAIGAIFSTIIANLYAIGAFTLYITPFIIAAYKYCSDITVGSPRWVEIICTIIFVIMAAK